MACGLAVATLMVSGSARAVEVEGRARIIDGDTLRIGSQVIRLEGIDAPEMDQRCNWITIEIRCGAQAARVLGRLIAGRPISCIGEQSDSYDRLIATCYLGRTTLNRQMVAQGWGVAFRKYSSDYIEAEFRARRNHFGLWAMSFVMPWEHRAARRRVTAQTPPRPGCRIKGNISRSGARIYHTRDSRWYDRTRVTPGRGERWFCSEAEALSAGWRAPLN